MSAPKASLSTVGTVCPKCGHWDADGGRKIPTDLPGQPKVTIDLAAMPQTIMMGKRLHILRQDLIEAGEHEWAKRVDEITTEFELRK